MRMSNPHILKSLRFTIVTVLGKEEELKKQLHPVVEQQVMEPKKRKRCALCDTVKDRKGNVFCSKCNLCVCGEHKAVICVKCAINNSSDDENEL